MNIQLGGIALVKFGELKWRVEKIEKVEPVLFPFISPYLPYNIITLIDEIGTPTSQYMVDWVKLYIESMCRRQGYLDGFYRDGEIEIYSDPLVTHFEKWDLIGCSIHKYNFGTVEQEEKILDNWFNHPIVHGKKISITITAGNAEKQE